MRRLIVIGLIAMTILVILIGLYLVFASPQLNVDGIRNRIADVVSCPPGKISYLAGIPHRECVAIFQVDCDVSLANFVGISELSGPNEYERMIRYYAGGMEVAISMVDEVRTYRGDTFTILYFKDGERRLIMYLGGT